MDPSSLEELARRLRDRPGAVAPLAARRAAVAIALFPREGRLAVQLMRRAERPGDPWSGQVSLPGGRAEPHDPDLVATAVREAREELGLELAAARLLGRLDDRMAIAQGKPLPMSVTPVVFALEAPPPPGPLDAREVARAFSVELAALSTPNEGSYAWKRGPLTLNLPCWRVDGEVIWGMTHRILGELLALFPARDVTDRAR